MKKIDRRKATDIVLKTERALDIWGRKKKTVLCLIVLFVLVLAFLGGRQSKVSGGGAENNVDRVLSGEMADMDGSGKVEMVTETSKLAQMFAKLDSRGALAAFHLNDEGQRTGVVLKVPDDYGSIQKAIDEAVSGDVVLVSAGEYKGNIVMKDGVSVIGESAENTILNGDKLGNVVTFKDIADQDTRLENFTVKNAKQDLSGILIENSSPLINRNIVLQNDYDIYIKGESSPTIQRNKLSESKAGVQIFNLTPSENSHPIISDNFLFGNKKGVNVYKGRAVIEHNTISFNSAYGIDAGATFGVYLASASAVIRNNIITDNGICEICGGIYIDADSKDVTIGFNDLWNNQNNFVCFGGCVMEENNLSSDPLFENGLLFNFQLKAESPLLLSGSDGQKLGARI